MTIRQNIGANHNESQRKIPLLIFKKIITSLASLLQAQIFVHCLFFFFLIVAISSFCICIESIGRGIMFSVFGEREAFGLGIIPSWHLRVIQQRAKPAVP